jgi:hypothetical protein
MGTLPQSPIKYDTTKKYISFIGGYLNRIKIPHKRSDGSIEEIKPLVRFMNTNKTLLRKQYERTVENRDIATYQDIWKFPYLTYKLSSLTYDEERQEISRYSMKGDIPDELNQADVQYLNPIKPYNFTFDITLYSNLYSHLLDFIENISYVFSPANVFDLSMFRSTTTDFKLIHRTVIYLNSLSIPDPIDVIDEKTNEAIQSVDVQFVVKGLIIPPITNAKVINLINSNILTVDNDFDFDDLEH